MKLEAFSDGEVLDIKVEMNKQLEDISIGFILEDEETPTLETETETLLGAITEPSTEERGRAVREVASQQYANAIGEGRRGQGFTVGTLAGKSAWPS